MNRNIPFIFLVNNRIVLQKESDCYSVQVVLWRNKRKNRKMLHLHDIETRAPRH
jgi:hypothetical protein